MEEDIPLANHLAAHINEDEYNVAALFLKSCHGTGGPLSGLDRVLQIADMSSTDNNGNNCLHHLTRGPFQGHLYTLYHKETNSQPDFEATVRRNREYFEDR